MKFNMLGRRMLFAVPTIILITYMYFTGYFQCSTINSTIEMPKSSAAIATGDHHDKWIVVMTASPPTESIKRLAKIPDWKLLVVGVEATPANWSIPGCTFLGLEEQKNLGYSIIDYIPRNSYTRKNIGYLYAIQHGAKYIYDTDDTALFYNLSRFSFEPTISGLIYEDTPGSVMNPFAHFGQPSIWPRGYPLNKVTQKNKNTYKLRNFWTPAIQQGMVSADPDLHVISRPTKKEQNVVLSPDIRFDHHAPPVILQNGIFAPFNSKYTLFHREAFWALMLPLSVPRSTVDICRGYFVQHLLWLIGQRLAFFPPASEKNKSLNINLLRYNDEFEETNLQYNILLDKLEHWSCKNPTLFECMYQLTVAITELKFSSETNIHLVQAWQTDLKKISYEPPKLLLNPRRNSIDKKLKSIISHPRANHRVYYSPSPKFDSISERRLDLLTLCSGKMNATDSANFINYIEHDVSYAFVNVVLIILFNEKYFKNMNFLDTLYRDHFPNMVICCPMGSYEDLMSKINEGFPQWRNRQFTFLNLTTENWYFAYECTIRVIEMNYQVDGYLLMGDDILLNPWSFTSKDLNKVHFINDDKKLIHIDRTFDQWVWWASSVGKNATIAALNEIECLSNGSCLSGTNRKVEQIMRTFVQTRYRNNVNMTLLMIASADIYYVPRSKSEAFVQLMKVFLRHRSILELAVPAVMLGLYDSELSEHVLKGHGLWGGDRSQVFSFFNTTNDYVHPLKFTNVFQSPELKSDYCNIYIRELLSHW